MSAIGGIDTALWDIKGKHYGAPIHDLLGGRTRDKIKIYQHVRRHRHSEEDNAGPEDIAEDAKLQVEKGFSMLKMTPTESFLRIDSERAVTEAKERLSAVREAVGNEVDIGLDFHGRMSTSLAKRMVTELEEFNPMFYEEPISPEQVNEMNEVSEKTNVPIAAGERVYSRWDFRPLFENLTLDIIQPDPSHAGGITEMKKIMDMGETYDVEFIPHTPYGPINLAAGLQVIALSKSAVAIEQLLHSEYHGDFDLLEYVEDPAVFDFGEGGYMDIPGGPGLGIEVDEAFVEEKARDGWNFDIHYERPEDGGIPREAAK
jgi:galactonate dehydratase